MLDAHYRLEMTMDGWSGKAYCGYPRCAHIASVGQVPIEGSDERPWKVLVPNGYVVRDPVSPGAISLCEMSRHARHSRHHAPARPHAQVSPYTGERVWVTGRRDLVSQGSGGTRVQHLDKVTPQTAMETHADWFLASVREAALLQPASWPTYGSAYRCYPALIIACPVHDHLSLVTYEALERKVRDLHERLT